MTDRAAMVTTVAIPGPQGPPGEPGSPGPPGGPGGGNYRHDQTVAAAVVTIVHNLGRYPAGVSLHSLDLSLNYTEYVVQHLDINTVRVSMDTPTACTVLLI